MESGIYKISNERSGRCYVGSAVNIRTRRRSHRAALERGDHANSHLQRAWNKYGADAFVFSVLERVEPALLIEREQAWMDKFDVVKSGYNICPVAYSQLGTTRTPEQIEKVAAANRGKKRTPEQRAALSAAQTGRKHSEAVKAKIGAGNRKPVSAEARANVAAANRERCLGKPGHPASDKQKASLIARNKARKGKPGRQWTPEQKAKLAATRRRMHAAKAQTKAQPDAG